MQVIKAGHDAKVEAKRVLGLLPLSSQPPTLEGFADTQALATGLLWATPELRERRLQHLSQAAAGPMDVSIRTGIASLSVQYLRHNLLKPEGVQRSQWGFNSRRLSKEQVEYAALDAWVSRCGRSASCCCGGGGGGGGGGSCRCCRCRESLNGVCAYVRVVMAALVPHECSYVRSCALATVLWGSQATLYRDGASIR
jgi:hypothetical protein